MFTPISFLLGAIFALACCLVMVVYTSIQRAMRSAERKQIDRENRQFSRVENYTPREYPEYTYEWYDNTRLWALLALLFAIVACVLFFAALPAFTADETASQNAEQSNCFVHPDSCLGVNEDEFKDGVSIHESMRAFFAQMGFRELSLTQVGFGPGQNLKDVLANYKGYRVAVLFVNDPAELSGFEKMTCAGWYGTVPGTIPSIPLQSEGVVVVYDSVLADSVISDFYTGWAANHPICSD